MPSVKKIENSYESIRKAHGLSAPKKSPTKSDMLKIFVSPPSDWSRERFLCRLLYDLVGMEYNGLEKLDYTAKSDILDLFLERLKSVYSTGWSHLYEDWFGALVKTTKASFGPSFVHNFCRLNVLYFKLLKFTSRQEDIDFLRSVKTDIVSAVYLGQFMTHLNQGTIVHTLCFCSENQTPEEILILLQRIGILDSRISIGSFVLQLISSCLKEKFGLEMHHIVKAAAEVYDYHADSNPLATTVRICMAERFSLSMQLDDKTNEAKEHVQKLQAIQFALDQAQQNYREALQKTQRYKNMIERLARHKDVQYFGRKPVVCYNVSKDTYALVGSSEYIPSGYVKCTIKVIPLSPIMSSKNVLPYARKNLDYSEPY